MSDKQMVTAAGRNNDKSVFKTSYPDGVLTSKPLVLWVDQVTLVDIFHFGTVRYDICYLNVIAHIICKSSTTI